jgi:hypothetical protein
MRPLFLSVFALLASCSDEAPLVVRDATVVDAADAADVSAAEASADAMDAPAADAGLDAD